ncbi:hypothetical protein [Luteimonas composti]|uniref:hypothetical protein n=1 Tax=Luteimonas composti TaxID=398257 RepID=UPI0036DB4EF4
MDDVRFKLARIQGEFVRHAHQDTGEVFIVIDAGWPSNSGTARWRWPRARCASYRAAPSIGRSRRGARHHAGGAAGC